MSHVRFGLQSTISSQQERKGEIGLSLFCVRLSARTMAIKVCVRMKKGGRGCMMILHSFRSEASMSYVLCLIQKSEICTIVKFIISWAFEKGRFVAQY